MHSTILLIDDDLKFLANAKEAIVAAGFDCDVCSESDTAVSLFSSKSYDGIVCDVLIPYQGVREGGLLLMKEFSAKNPSASLVLVSQFVTAKWVNLFAGVASYAFVEKGENTVPDLLCEINRIVKSRFVFVCMPFQREFDNLYEAAIKPVVEECGYKCVRADEIEHNSTILGQIIDRIEGCHLVIAEMTNSNPNVMYEVGYAHASGKDVVLLTNSVSKMPFDVRGINHIVYEGRVGALKEKLRARLRAMRR